jgi:hypothetical protein
MGWEWGWLSLSPIPLHKLISCRTHLMLLSHHAAKRRSTKRAAYGVAERREKQKQILELLELRTFTDGVRNRSASSKQRLEVPDLTGS